MRKILAAVPVAALALAACVPTGEAPPERSDRPAEEPATEAPQEQTEKEAQPEPEEAPQEAPPETTEPERQAPDLSDFSGMEGSDGVFDIHINDAYVDDDGYVSDTYGYTATAAEGFDFVVFDVELTNISKAPAYWSGYDNEAQDIDGNLYLEDEEASMALAGDYLFDDINPGSTQELGVVFQLPEGTEVDQVFLSHDPYSGSFAVFAP